MDGFDADSAICHCLFGVVLRQLEFGDVAMVSHAAHHQLGCVQRFGHVLGLYGARTLPFTLFSMLTYGEPILLFVLAVVFMNAPLTGSAMITYGFRWA